MGLTSRDFTSTLLPISSYAEIDCYTYILTPTMPQGQQLPPDYNEDWLPEDFKPMSFKQLLWNKLSNAPMVGVGGYQNVDRHAIGPVRSRF